MRRRAGSAACNGGEQVKHARRVWSEGCVLFGAHLLSKQCRPSVYSLAVLTFESVCMFCFVLRRPMRAVPLITAFVIAVVVGLTVHYRRVIQNRSERTNLLKAPQTTSDSSEDNGGPPKVVRVLPLKWVAGADVLPPTLLVWWRLLFLRSLISCKQVAPPGSQPPSRVLLMPCLLVRFRAVCRVDAATWWPPWRASSSTQADAWLLSPLRFACSDRRPWRARIRPSSVTIRHATPAVLGRAVLKAKQMRRSRHLCAAKRDGRCFNRSCYCKEYYERLLLAAPRHERLMFFFFTNLRAWQDDTVNNVGGVRVIVAPDLTTTSLHALCLTFPTTQPDPPPALQRTLR